MSEDISGEFWDKLAERIAKETSDSNTDFTDVIKEQKALFDSFEKELLRVDKEKIVPEVDEDEVYALYNKSEEVLGKSSSGGVFDALANWVLDNNGYVCAACYDYEQNELRHILFNEKEQIEKCQGSKYFQSRISSDIYEGVKKLLNENTKVLFVGTPCQVAGIKKYCEASGIRYLSSHKIRFYAVTEQARAGLDLAKIQYNSGHKCKSTTLHYIRNASNDAVSDDRWEKVFG